MNPFINKSVWIILLISGAHLACSQTVSQGVWVAGGSADFSSLKQQGVSHSTTALELLPDGGYYVIDNLGVGLNVAYSRTSQNNASLTSIDAGPWVRYYVIDNAFAQSGFSLGNTTINGEFGKAKTKETALDLGVGYSAWITKAVALEPIAYFKFGRQKDEGTDPVKTSTFGLRIGLQVYFGNE